MNKYNIINKVLLGIAVLFHLSCSEESTLETDPFVVAFTFQSFNLQSINNSQVLDLEFSRIPEYEGTFTVGIISNDMVYN